MQILMNTEGMGFIAANLKQCEISCEENIKRGAMSHMKYAILWAFHYAS